MNIRIIHWNISYKCNPEKICNFIKSKLTDSCIINLLEVKMSTYDFLLKNLINCNFEYSLNYRQVGLYEGENRRMGILTITTSNIKVNSELLNNTLLPERTLLSTFQVGDKIIRNLSFHALTGCDYGKAKSSNFASIASYIKENPVQIMTFDANEPKTDSINIDEVIGFDNKDKGRNALLLIGKTEVHSLKDCFREYVGSNQKLFNEGYTHIIHKNIYKRYDYIFIDQKYSVKNFENLYQESINASADHSMLIADIEI